MKYPTLWKIAALLVSQACFTPALAASSGKTYTVKSGDTVTKIARANHVSVDTLLKANRLSGSGTLKSGQRLTIPGTAKTTTAAKKPATTKTTTAAAKSRASKPAATGKTRREDPTTVNITPPPRAKSPASSSTPRAGTYVIQSGDTLNRIQRRTGTPVATLMKLNGLKESSVLRIGQPLRISGSANVAAVAKNQPVVAPSKPPRSRQTLPYIQEPEPVTTPEVPRIQEPPSLPPASGEPGTPVPAAPPVPAPAPAAPPSTTAPHKVEPGETFTSIGRLYGVSQTKLIAANPGVSPAKLKAGQTLKIPGQPVRPGTQPVVVRADGRILASRPDPLAGGVPVTAAVERTRTGYLVEDGETLTQIAQRFHTTERELRQMNRLGESDSIYAGRYILVPFIRQAPAANTYARRGN